MLRNDYHEDKDMPNELSAYESDDTASVTESDDDKSNAPNRPASAKWLITNAKQYFTSNSETESESDTESDNDDVEETVEMGGKWLQVKVKQEPIDDFGNLRLVESMEGKQEVAGRGNGAWMGEDENAMEYDPDLIFRHLYVHPLTIGNHTKTSQMLLLRLPEECPETWFGCKDEIY
jgi:hypothetical protein